ncbi:hypothetical protein EZS27_004717 [termite gut metagenome]|uniref:Uncharacterized protein n=1 Tax=termite gut metagenome TaxID=433724 RepID=A0A5J4SPW5_9ZZZZ
MEINRIPHMTDPLSRAWEQPLTEDILLDDKHALMHQEDFDTLHEYSLTLPSGVYEGKMWKCSYEDRWLLCWYDKDDDPSKCSIKRREIILL